MISKDLKKKWHKALKEQGVKTGYQELYRMIEVFNQGNGYTIDDIHEKMTRMIHDAKASMPTRIELRDKPAPYNIIGKHLVSRNAIDDFDALAHLPYVVEGALMSDGHRVAPNHAPVGTVFKTEPNVVMPSVVGNDIWCSVMLTTYYTYKPLDDYFSGKGLKSIVHALEEYTYFGQEIAPPELREKMNQYEVFNKGYLDDKLQSDLGRNVYNHVWGIARNQFASSGDGNHFVNLCRVVWNSGREMFGIMSHFGSRKVGAIIANEFEDFAKSKYELPKGYTGHPLYLDTPEGHDYWVLMNWAGEFAKYGHAELHNWLAQHILGYVASDTHVYVPHNFAELGDDGYIIHRKGATPARDGSHGIIPATMGHASRLIRGLGNPESLNSASHGAGRTHSRGSALQEFGGVNTQEFVKKEYGITLIGGGADEDPRAYKSIDEVMEAQRDSCVTLAKIHPVVVRMAEPRIFNRRGR